MIHLKCYSLSTAKWNYTIFYSQIITISIFFFNLQISYFRSDHFLLYCPSSLNFKTETCTIHVLVGAIQKRCPHKVSRTDLLLHIRAKHRNFWTNLTNLFTENSLDVCIWRNAIPPSSQWTNPSRPRLRTSFYEQSLLFHKLTKNGLEREWIQSSNLLI